MSTIPKPDERTIYLLTESTSSAATDVAQNRRVLLSYQGGGDHVSASAKFLFGLVTGQPPQLGERAAL